MSQVNCHPFQYRQFLWMQNGWIPDFSKIRRRLRDRLSDEFYNMIQGTTDTKHAFALFLHRLRKRMQDYNLDTLRQTMVRTISDLTMLHRDSGCEEPAFFNFALTDGHNIVATRCVSDVEVAPQTLYVATGRRFISENGAFDMTPADGHVEAAIIASEPLTSDRADWGPVPVNHMVTVSPELHVKFAALD